MNLVVFIAYWLTVSFYFSIILGAVINANWLLAGLLSLVAALVIAIDAEGNWFAFFVAAIIAVILVILGKGK